MLRALTGRKKPDLAEKRRLGAAWRKRLIPAPPSQDGLVVFAIPLVARARCKDWATISRNVARTIASLRRQTSSRWVALICGQDRPDGVHFDSQVQFVRFRGLVLRQNEKGVRGWDKGDKRVRLIRTAMRRFAGRDGYYAQWDAVDLLHPFVVEHVLSGNNGRGYLIETGVMADLDAGRFGLLAPRAAGGTTHAFWRMCGSSSFVRFDFRTQPRLWKELLSRHSSHKALVEWMEAYDLPLEPIPFPAALYTYNHGENYSALKGNDGRRNAYLDRNPLPEVDILRTIEDFALTPRRAVA